MTNIVREYYRNQWQPAEFTHEGSDAAYGLFNQLAPHTLPYLPAGYQWTSTQGKYYLRKRNDAKQHSLKVVLYERQNQDSLTLSDISYITLVDGVHTQAYAHANKNAVFTGERKYPFAVRPKPGRLTSSVTGYQVPGYDYAAAGITTKSAHHCPGHAVDHADSRYIGDLCSTYDPRNYIPEVPGQGNWWGLSARNKIVKSIRNTPQGGAYMQWVHYSDNPQKTRSGAPVPEGVFFSDLAADKHYNPLWSMCRTQAGQERSIDQMLEQCSVDKKITPTAHVYKASLTNKLLFDFAKERFTTANEIRNHTLPSLRPEADALRIYLQGSDFEIGNMNNTLESSILFSEAGKPEDASVYLSRALRWTEHQVQNEQRGVFITARKRQELEDLLQQEKILDADDSKKDRLRKVCADQRRKVNRLTTS